MANPERSAGSGPAGQGANGAPAGAPPAPGPNGDPAAISVAGFAAQLRELREQAGRPSYRKLAQLAHYSHTALSQAAAGQSLPSLAVTQAFVRACGGDVEQWSARWREAGQAVQPPGEPPHPSGQGPARAHSRRQAVTGGLRAKARITAAGLAASACITAVVLLTVGPAAVTSQPGQAPPRLVLESSGLYVRYAVVTNHGTRAGYAYVLNTGPGKAHRSPQPVPPGQSWTYVFDRDLKNGAQICGYIDRGPATCTRVYA